jgi:hypothetical protein
MSRDRLFLFVAGVLIAVILSVGGYFLVRLRASSKSKWSDLLKRLTAINEEAIETVALDAIDPSGKSRTDPFARELAPEQIWKLLGELEGVEQMEANSRVLIEMAAYLQRSYSEAAEVAEELRLQAKELGYHVGRLRMAAQQGSLPFHINAHARNAAIAYYLMEQRLHKFCERINLPVVMPLENAR